MNDVIQNLASLCYSHRHLAGIAGPAIDRIKELEMMVDTNGMYIDAAKEHIEMLEAKIAKLQNGLVDMLEGPPGDTCAKELRSLYDIANAPNRTKEQTHDPD